MSKLSFISSGDRKYVISRTLSLIKSDVVTAIKDRQRVVIKPYCYYSSDQLSSTHVDALEAVLEFIAPYVSKQIVLAEGTTVGKTLDAFRNYDYFKLQDIYDFAIVDLNDDAEERIDFDNGFSLKVPETLLNADFIISLTPPRYDNRLLFAGAAVNILEPVFSLNNSIGKKLVQKFSIKKPSQPKAEFFDSVESKQIFSKLQIGLSVIDAYSIKKGVTSSHLNAPHWGASSTDYVSNDCLASQLLGVPIDKVDYLNALSESIPLDSNVVVGDDWRNHIIM